MKSPYTGFFSGQIIGPKAINNYLLTALAGELEAVFGAFCGETVLDPTGTGTGLGLTASADTLNNRRLNITGNKQVVTDAGDLMTCGASSTTRVYTSGSWAVNTHDSLWFANLPYRNDSGSTYYVYAGQTKFPVDVGIARDLSMGYSVWTDAVGWTVTPDTVALNGSGKIILKLDTALTALGMQKWLTTHTQDDSWSYYCVVWLDSNHTGVTVCSQDPAIAIAFAHLTKDTATGAWRVDLTALGDGKLGQVTASTTPAFYKIAILGPIITNTSTLQTSSSWTFLGTTLSGVSETISTAGQAITTPYASYAAGFAVEHNATTGDPDLGRHKRVTAQAGEPLLLQVDDAADQEVRLHNTGVGAAVLVVEDWAKIPEINQDADFIIDLEDSLFDRYIFMRNSGSHTLTVYVDGTLECVTTTGGSGIIKAHTRYEMSSATLYGAKYDALSIMMAGAHHFLGTGTPQYNSGGGITPPYFYAGGSITAVLTVLVPIFPPTDFVVSQFRVRQYQIGGPGSENIRVAIGRWDESAILVVNVTGWQQCNTRTGAFVTETLAFAGVTLADAVTHKYYLMLEITNDGTTVDTARVAKVHIQGLMAHMPTFQV